MNTSIDLETNVVNRYTGEARMQRLMWIATRTTNIAINQSPDSNQEEYLLQRLAYEAAAQFAIQQQNAARYKDIFHQYNEKNVLKSPPRRHEDASTTEISGSSESRDLLDVFDAHWYNDTFANNRQNRDILQSRLQASQAHLNKEAIRVAYLAIAEFATRTGDMSEAFHAVLRAKDFCTTRQQTTTVTLQILMYSTLLRNFQVVRDYVPRLEHTVVTATPSSAASTVAVNTGSGALDPALCSTVRICVWIASGLAKLSSCDYKGAAECFRSISLSGQNNGSKNVSSPSSVYSPESTGGNDLPSATLLSHASWDTNVLAPEDVAMYAAFLTLAVEDNRSVVMNLAEDPEALELVPQMKEVLVQFTRLAQYKVAFTILEKAYVPLLRHDLYMSQHVDSLTQLIRNRAILMYWKPYQKIELETMAFELGSSIVRPPSSLIKMPWMMHSLDINHENRYTEGSGSAQLLQSLLHLIANNRSSLGHETRIDLQTNSLVRDAILPEDERLMRTTRKLQATSSRVLNDSYGMMVRMACQSNNIRVLDPADKRRRGYDNNALFSDWERNVGRRQQLNVSSDDDDDDLDIGDRGASDEIENDDELEEHEQVEDDAQMMDATNDGMNPEDLY